MRAKPKSIYTLSSFMKYALVLLALLAALAPVYWLITISLKSEVDQFAVPPRWLNFSPTLVHYKDAFVARSFGQYLITSAIVAVLSTVCALVLGTFAAYALARFRLRSRACGEPCSSCSVSRR